MVRLMALVALLLALPAVAMADPVTAAVASTLVGWGVNTTVASLAAGFLTSTAFNMARGALSGKQRAGSSGTAAVQALKQDSSLPAWRFVYGECWAAGTPTGIAVKGENLYGCWILNSRPSEGPFELMLDKRKVALVGDAFDFAGPGATGADDPFGGHLQVWIGRGEQATSPKRFTTDMPDHFRSTDAWRGLTVIWMIMRSGNPKYRQERWPSNPPDVVVSGKWSRVWDMRDPIQSANDPTTWTWSANQALCALDALRHNPIKHYADRHLWLETWRWAADVAGERVAVKGGGTIPRYEVNGTIAYSEGAELEDQLEPLMVAGAARFVRARGQLGIIPGCPQTPTMVLDDMLVGSGASLQRYAERDSLATAVAGTFLAPDRAYEDTALPTFTIAGAREEDGGLEQILRPDLAMVTDHRQGQRVQKILALRTRMQRQITAEFPPEAFDLVAGSWVRTAPRAPFARWSGVWEVQSTLPQVDLKEEGGVAFRCQMTVQETSDAVYAWNAATEEQDVEAYEFDVQRPAVQPPRDVVVDMRDTNDRTASGILEPRFRVAFTPSASGSVMSYEWQLRLASEEWPDEAERITPAGDALRIVAFGPILSQTALQDFRIRAVGARGESGWIVVPGLARNFELSGVTFAGGVRRFGLIANAPTNGAFYGVRIFRSDRPDFATAVRVHQVTSLQAGEPVAIEVTGANPGNDYFWAVPLTQTYSLGRPDGPHRIVIAPAAT